MDRVSPEARSANMSAVRSKNTGPEMRVRRTAHAMGLRYRLHRRDLPGSPDLVFPRRRTVVFVHGCFWHQHLECRKAEPPKSNVDFWRAKLNRNAERDGRYEEALRAAGWNVVVIWECETRSQEAIRSRLRAAVGEPSVPLLPP